MSWAAIEKKKFGTGRNIRYGEKWSEVPAIACTKTGCTLNAAFAKSFVNGHREMKLFIDIEGGRVGFRPVESGEGGFTIKPQPGKSISLNIGSLAKALASHQGRAYAAKHNAIDNVIEVALSPSNQLG